MFSGIKNKKVFQGHTAAKGYFYMSREMIINVAQGEECRIALLENEVLQELYIERKSRQRLAGNIYKGKVVNIEPGIQAAFVDFGIGKNGFLHISDLHPKYFSKAEDESHEKIGKRQALKQRPPIQDCLKRGQDLIVQVTKEGIRSKGPTLSTYLSFPGKYIVMMPWMERFGVSHKLENEEERQRLREILEETKLPDNAGFIIRTAAEGASKKNIKNDLAYLIRLWGAIEKRIESAPSPSEIFQESDLVIRTLRDIFTSQIEKIICDSKEVTEQIKDFLGIAMPRQANRAIYYDGKVPLFFKYNIEKEIAKIHSSRVELPSGGSVVIEQTEALVAIDVNSGKYRKQIDAEKTALKINVEAAKEIIRQLKLRDLGGLIICDFIDMRSEKNRKEVEKVFRDAAKEDRARSKILRMSSFGILEMTRQRMRPSLELSVNLECPYCNGTGMIRTQQSLAIDIMRKISASASKPNVKRIDVAVSPAMASYLLNDKRQQILEMETSMEKKIVIHSNIDMYGDAHNIVCYDTLEVVVKQ
jgi:ribonuclease E